MITLLSKILIENQERNADVKRRMYGTLCSVVGIFLNICLFTGKYMAGTASGSIAITADAFNNLSDAGSSFITLVGFFFAGKKPDIGHPFGHGRFEYISGFVVSMAIILMGFELLRNSVEKIIHPVPVSTSTLSMCILVVSICVKLYMCFYNRSVGKKIDSSAMRATSTDSLSDAVATSFVLIAMIILKYSGKNIDGICGVIVAFFILFAGVNAAKDTLSPLLGTMPQEEYVKSIKDLVLSHKQVIGMHDLIVHDYGPGRTMISLHAEVDGSGNIFELHDCIDLIERELEEKLGCEAVIHMDPLESDNDEISKVRASVAEALKKNIDEAINIHDFRMVKGPTHTNLIFDAVVPPAYLVKEDELTEKIEQTVKSIDDKYFAIVKIDMAYV